MKKLRLILIFTVFIIAGYLLYSWLTGGVNKNTNQAPPPPQVDTLILESKPITFYQSLPGRTTAYQIAEIRPQVNGIIIDRLFVEGSQVKEGDQLYQIDPALYQAELASAKADLFRAQANFKTIETKLKRYEELLSKKTVSKQDFEDVELEAEKAKAEIAIAEALVDKAEINLNYTKVYAPISGQIGRSSVTKGALVTASQSTSLATITRLDPIYVDLTQPSEELLRIRNQLNSNKNLKVTLYTKDQESTYPLSGELQFSDVQVDESTDSVSLRALFPNPKGLLLPGQFVRAKIHLQTKNSILVPQGAVLRNQDGSTQVWLLNRDNTVDLKNVTVNQSYENHWEITDGLEVGDTILLNGFQKIRPGATVVPADNSASQATQ